MPELVATAGGLGSIFLVGTPLVLFRADRGEADPSVKWEGHAWSRRELDNSATVSRQGHHAVCDGPVADQHGSIRYPGHHGAVVARIEDKEQLAAVAHPHTDFDAGRYIRK